uniref:Uncharacterized protein n=1 Tax=Pipistrellus kuhlii TaxID=59472 RepID=A0A7J7XVL3_PIPKU|nr:hypothetical protein mPipKuh1_010492 [Pipistrellus kuhlii]
MLYISTYTFRAWSLSTYTFQVLHEISVGDKVQKLVLHERTGTPKPPWLMCKPGSTITSSATQRVTANSKQMWLCAPGVLFSYKKVICLPSSASRSHKRAFYVEGPGLIIQLTFYPIKPSVKSTTADGLKCKEP